MLLHLFYLVNVFSFPSFYLSFSLFSPFFFKDFSIYRSAWSLTAFFISFFYFFFSLGLVEAIESLFCIASIMHKNMINSIKSGSARIFIRIFFKLDIFASDCYYEIQRNKSCNSNEGIFFISTC